MSKYSVSLAPKKYNVTLGNDTKNLKVSVGAPNVKPAIQYHLDTPVNTEYGVMTLVVDSTNTITDSVTFIGQGLANVTSNGSTIVVNADVGDLNVDGGVF